MTFLRLLGDAFLFVFAIQMESTISWEIQWTWLLTCVWVISPSNDIILAISLTLALYRRRSQSRNRRYSETFPWMKRSFMFHYRTVAIVDKVMKWTLG